MTKEERISKHLKEAFCIDGECQPIGAAVVGLISEEPRVLLSQIANGRVYLLNDSKRGKFYITMSYGTPEKVTENK